MQRRNIVDSKFGDREFNLMKQFNKYQSKYKGQPVVVKIGGNAMKSLDTTLKLVEEFAYLKSMGIKLVLVHGGAPEIKEALNKSGIESKFKDGVRVTDDDTLKVAETALHNLNKKLVNLVLDHGINAVGLSGIDGNMLVSTQIGDKDLGNVGKIVKVNTDIINAQLNADFLPIIDPICRGDKKGYRYNVNADDVAMALAEALKAKLILMTEANGVRRDKNDPKSVIPMIDISKGEVQKLIDEGIVADGMIAKVKACEKAIKNGAYSVSIIEGAPLKLTQELITDKGTGTEFINSAKEQQKFRTVKIPYINKKGRIKTQQTELDQRM